jgi:tRNA_anti-like
MKSFKTIALVFIILAVAVAAYGWFFLWNKPKTNVAKADGVKIEAAALFTEYSNNEQAANTKYLEKILEVSGEVTSVTKNAEGFTVVLLKTDDLMFGVNCTLEQKDVLVKKGDKVTLKGICTGYLTDVVLIRCYKTN